MRSLSSRAIGSAAGTAVVAAVALTHNLWLPTVPEWQKAVAAGGGRPRRQRGRAPGRPAGAGSSSLGEAGKDFLEYQQIGQNYEPMAH